MDILPGGVKLHNVEEFVPRLGCSQIHIASFIQKFDPSVGQKPHVFFGSASKSIEDRYGIIDRNFVRQIREKVDSIIC
jgi:copper homeostasis protein CutC